jgi:hypothetical protein
LDSPIPKFVLERNLDNLINLKYEKRNMANFLDESLIENLQKKESIVGKSITKGLKKRNNMILSKTNHNLIRISTLKESKRHSR